MWPAKTADMYIINDASAVCVVSELPTDVQSATVASPDAYVPQV